MWERKYIPTHNLSWNKSQLVYRTYTHFKRLHQTSEWLATRKCIYLLRARLHRRVLYYNMQKVNILCMGKKIYGRIIYASIGYKIVMRSVLYSFFFLLLFDPPWTERRKKRYPEKFSVVILVFRHARSPESTNSSINDHFVYRL